MERESIATATERSRKVDIREGYRMWARVYDDERNPFLSLEERYLRCLLPTATGADVLDLGCGTGRWLRYFAERKPRTLVGVDASPEMLQRAKQKLGCAAELWACDCEQFLALEAGADLVLCSFLSSYIENLDAFAHMLSRTQRPGGSVFLTDIHPQTIEQLHWRRGFKIDGESIEVQTHPRSLDDVIRHFCDAGFRVDALLQPSFGDPEFEPFEKANKTAEWSRASALPAIYILQVSVPGPKQIAVDNPAAATLRSVTSSRIALGANEFFSGSMAFESGDVVSLDGGPASAASVPGSSSVDLAGFLILPGLVNSHDHLDFALFPRLGRGGYDNYAEWAADIHDSDSTIVRQHRAVPRETRLRWGGIRNLLCGVTTVCHHNPYDQTVFDDGFPLRVLKAFGWAHSLTFDADVASKKTSTPPDQPFILHLAEGVDALSAEELFRLERESGIDSRTVIVHGLGIDQAGRKLIRSNGASLIWCPSSNVFLFGRTQTADDLRDYPSIALGNDSPLTAKGDLLDEIRFARESSGLSADELFEMVTTRAAAVLKLRGGEGTLRIGGHADFFAVRDRGLSPSVTLSQLSYRDVELVVVGGQVRLASSDTMRRLPNRLTAGLQSVRVGGELRWIRQDVRPLFEDAQAHIADPLQLNGRGVQCELAD